MNYSILLTLYAADAMATVDQYKLNKVKRLYLADLKKFAIKSVYGIGCPPCESFLRLRWLGIKTLEDNCVLSQEDADCIIAKLYENCG